MTQKYTVIGLTGPAGSGKDTVAEMLHTHAGARTLAFADALRAEIINAYSIDLALLLDRETKEAPTPQLALKRCLDHGFVGRMISVHATGTREGGIARELLDTEAPRSPRQIMQWWGTEYRRAQEPRYWVSKAATQIAWLQRAISARLIVITDVRFADEAELVRRLGGQMWQIKRPGCDATTSSHVSETTGEGFHPNLVINNRHDLRHLQQLVLGGWAAHDWGLTEVRIDLSSAEKVAP